MWGKKPKETTSDSQTKLSDIILSAIDDGVVLINPTGQIASFNPAAAEITGWKTADTQGLDYKSVLKFMNKKGEEYETDPIASSMAKKEVVRDNELEIETSSKKQVPIFISCSPLINGEESFEGVVAVFRDVSKERVEESQRAEFISTASHEMRTPVAAIEGYLALATNEAVCKIDSKARDYLEKAHSSTRHLGKLFQDLLTAAKSEDGRLTNHPVVVEMGAFLQEVADANRFAAQKKKLLVEFLVGSESDRHFSQSSTTTDATVAQPSSKTVRPLYYSSIDPDRMREAITNLFDNAVKYTEQGKITISIAGDDKVVQLRVTDTGPGIPQEDTPHLFQKFYRVDNSSTRTVGGTGLGLFITKKIVELYNGKIWVESTLDKGSTFFINLPRLSSMEAQKKQSQESSNTIVPTESLGSPKI